MKAGTVLRLAAPRYIESHAENLREGMTAVLSGVLNTADLFNKELEAARRDQDLAPRGRAKSEKRVAASALSYLAHVEQTAIKGLDDHANHLERQLLGRVTFTPPQDPAERIAHELQMQEIRGQLRQLPATQRLVVYMTTADPLVLAAIETAPQTLSDKRPDGTRRLEAFVDPEERTTASLARAERLDPESTAKLREVRSLRECYTHAVNSVRKEILNEVPAAAPESKPTIRVSE